MKKYLLIIFGIIYLFFFGIFDVRAEHFGDYYSTSGLRFYNYWYLKENINVNNNYRLDYTQLYDLPSNTTNLQFYLTIYDSKDVVNYDNSFSLSCTTIQTSGNGVSYCTQWNYLNNLSLQVYVNEEKVCKLDNMSLGGQGLTFYVDCPIYRSNYDSLNIILIANSGSYSNISIGTSYVVTTLQSSLNSIKNDTSDIKNSINDSSIDSNGASSSASSWNSKNATNGTITNLLTLPITLLQAIVNGLQTSCSSFSLGSLFGTNITLPCINVGNLIGSGLWTSIDILFSGFMILAIAKKLIKIFNDFTNLKSNQIDELYGGGNK